jgi:hypothetical protein
VLTDTYEGDIGNVPEELIAVLGKQRKDLKDNKGQKDRAPGFIFVLAVPFVLFVLTLRACHEIT